MTELFALNRRAFMGGGAALAAAAGLHPSWARSVSPGLAAKAQGTLRGDEIKLSVARTKFSVDGRSGHAVAVEGCIGGGSCPGKKRCVA